MKNPIKKNFGAFSRIKWWGAICCLVALLCLPMAAWAVDCSNQIVWVKNAQFPNQFGSGGNITTGRKVVYENHLYEYTGSATIWGPYIGNFSPTQFNSAFVDRGVCGEDAPPPTDGPLTVTGVSVNPTSATHVLGTAALSLTANVSGSGTGFTGTVNWSVSGGTATTSTHFSKTTSNTNEAITLAIPTNETSGIVITVTATSVDDNTKSATATITIATDPCAAVPYKQYVSGACYDRNERVKHKGNIYYNKYTAQVCNDSEPGTSAGNTYWQLVGSCGMTVVNSVSLSPTSATYTLAQASPLSLTATVSGWGDDFTGNVNWSVSGATATTSADFSKATSASGEAITLTIPNGETASSITVTATSADDASKKATATITISKGTVSAIAITDPSPANVTLSNASSKQFTAVVTKTGVLTGDVNWTVSGDNGGTFLSANTSASGSPITLNIGAQQTIGANVITLTATSAEDATKSVQAKITVVEKDTITSVSVAKDGGGVAEVDKGKTLQLKETVTKTGNITDLSVTWSITSAKAAGTSIDQTGKLTVASNETASSITVKATSNLSFEQYGEIMVAVLDPIYVTSVTISPASNVVVERSLTQEFSVVVVGGGTKYQGGVVWNVSDADKAGTRVLSQNATSCVVQIDANEGANEITLKATSVDDDSKVDEVKITVVDKVSVTGVVITECPTEVDRGETYTLKVRVDGTGAYSSAVAWVLSDNAATTTIVDNSDGTATLKIGADESSPIKISVTSVAENTKSATATINVAVVNSVSIEGPNAIQKKRGKMYSATLNGTGNYANEVVWSITGNNSAQTKLTEIKARTVMLNIGEDETANTITLVATSKSESAKFASKAITVEEYVVGAEITAVNVNPSSAVIKKGHFASFEATVTGTGTFDPGVVWEIKGALHQGTVLLDKTANSVLISIDKKETASSITLVAKAAGDNDIFAQVDITVETVEPKITGVSVSPITVEIIKGSNKSFDATVSGEGEFDEGIVWSITGAKSAETKLSATTGASVTLSIGENETATSITLVAKAAGDASKSVEATITVKDVPSAVTKVTITGAPADKFVEKGNSYTFGVEVAGTGAFSKAVTWGLTGEKGATRLSGKTNNAATLEIGADETSGEIVVTLKSNSNSSVADTLKLKLKGATGVSSVAKKRSDFGILLLSETPVTGEKAEFEILTPQPSEVSVVILDNQGNALFVQNDKTKKIEGVNSLKVEWNLTNAGGRKVAGGTYIIQATAKSASQVYKYTAPVGVKK